MIAIGDATLYLGECLEVLRGLPDGCVESVVTDPPYALTAQKKGGTGANSRNLKRPAGRSRIGTSGGFMGQAWDGALPDPDIWVECLRVLKPGGHLLAFGGTRTHHRLWCAIEDAGFELRDTVGWLYGQGFPKSLDISKAIDKAAGAERDVIGPNRFAAVNGKANVNAFGSASRPDATAPSSDAARQWNGWGSALKPAFEPIALARKPLSEKTIAANVLAHGCGGLNIDGSRIPSGEDYRKLQVVQGGNHRHDVGLTQKTRHAEFVPSSGRFPANLIHDGSEDVVALFPETKSGSLQPHHQRTASKTKHAFGARAAPPESTDGDQGSAARFFYCAKASRSDRGEGNGHPTVKPQALMAYLCRLVTPPGGLVLDPFMGSGTTGVAALRQGFRFIGIEREPAYVTIATTRLADAQRQGAHFGQDPQDPDSDATWSQLDLPLAAAFSATSEAPTS
ncbi:DNA methyltransferase [uncultured Thiocystis sp.]|uniref:DNA-methyltransferase n=1 Tax=uncultured Thiocystis sp. TaxID=1202134 RepID=UPI00343731E6